MPSATSEKLNQLRIQLQDCTNPKVAQVLKSAIAKLEAQLNPGQVQAKAAKAKSSKVAERKSALKKSQREANRIASRQHRTNLKPPSLSKVEPKPEAVPQDEKPTSPEQGRSKVRTEATSELENLNSEVQTQVKVTPKVSSQDKKTGVSQVHPKSYEPPKRPPLLPGNGTHRAWCRIPGIIRVRQKELEEGKQKSFYFVEVDGYPVKLFLSKKSFKRIKSILDKPIMIFGYPNIMKGQITSLQLTGTSQRASEKTENLVLIGVWRADKQRVLIQRDQERDPEIHIRQHSPFVSEDCLRELEDGKLYEFACQRDGITVTVVGIGEPSPPKQENQESTEQGIVELEFSDQAIIDKVLSGL